MLEASLVIGYAPISDSTMESVTSIAPIPAQVPAKARTKRQGGTARPAASQDRPTYP
ncbi:hypothetical protein [Pelagicoccus sp. SDUM812003]|uniref:hypothetical protein n=1 Tax=Pelagicoccus sp. SDUM812003 TaxID=3041267 RepID=UPI00280D700C|nr:hypothetical protein [Pelagicoccus sp. SDUM812003]MDQ8204291.1 hypothetical protein [Pelagicoccus sp. SDUM812003]